MNNEKKTKEQLMTELIELRQRIAELEISEIKHKQVEKALKESKDKYSTIVEKGNDGIAISQDGKVKFANSKLLELSGFALEETVEKQFIDFISPESRELVMEWYKKRIAGEQIPNRYEIELHTKDGINIPVEINASLIEYEGKPASLAIIRDISERKKVEKALHDSEKKFRELSELLPQIIYETDIEGNLTFTNRVGFEILGYYQEDLDRGLNAFELIVPEDHERLEENISRYKKGEVIGINEYTARRKDGSRFPVVVHSNVIRDDEGKPVGIRGIMINILERKKAEKEIFRAKEYLEKVFNSVTDSIFVTDMNRRFLTCNNATERIFGYKKEEIIGKSAELFYPTKRAFKEMAMNIEKEIKEKGYADGEMTLRRKDGIDFPAYATASLLKETDGTPIGIVGTVRDITTRKLAEERIKNYTENLENLVEERAKELKESEEKLKAILTGIGAFITIQNKDLDIIWANQPIRELWGEIVGRKCYEVYKGLTVPCPECTVKKVFKEGKTTVSEQISTLPDGTQMHVLVTSSPVRDAEGNIIAVVEVDKDITERKKLEQELKNYSENLEKIVDTRTIELKESEEKLNAILTGIADLITIQNRELDIIWVNQPMKDLYGDIIGKKCYKVYKRRNERCEDCYIEKIFNEGKTVISERESILPDGSLIHVLITSSPVRDAKGNIVAILEVEKDITEQKKLERQLVESEAKQQAILSAIGDFITIQNKELDIIWANQPIKDHWGDVLGKKCYKVYKCFNEHCPQCTVETVFNEGKTLVSEQVVIDTDGKSMNTLVTSSPVRDAEGNIFAVLEAVKDITERKKLEVELRESEKRYRGLYESSIDGIVSLDIDGNIVECNQAYANLLGYSKEELYALNIYDLTPDKWIERNKKFHDQLLTVGYSEEFEKEYIKKDGSIVSIAIRGWPIKNKEGKTIG
ncbi:MAG: PAS domain-containing protein, partial [Promethearchaeota archaeon]